MDEVRTARTDDRGRAQPSPRASESRVRPFKCGFEKRVRFHRAGEERTALPEACAKFRDKKLRAPWLSVAEGRVRVACDGVATGVAGAGLRVGAPRVTLRG